MIDKSFVEKLQSEKPLDWQDVAELDRLLESSARSKAALSTLEDTEPSLAWRSSLNEKLLTSVKRRKKMAFMPWLGGLATVAAACAALMIVTSPKPMQQPTVKPASIEASLVSIHAQDAKSATDSSDDISDLLPEDSTPDM